jgi:hypothetical protein
VQWSDPEVMIWVFNNFVTYGTSKEFNLLVDQVSEFVNERKL